MTWNQGSQVMRWNQGIVGYDVMVHVMLLQGIVGYDVSIVGYGMLIWYNVSMLCYGMLLYVSMV